MKGQIETQIYFELVLHDLGNLNLQVLEKAFLKERLDEIADKINFLMGQAGKQSEFVAEVIKKEYEMEAWQKGDL